VKAKFFVDKLKIQVLPAVLCFVDGLVVDRVVGFEEIDPTVGDDFSTEALERRLLKSPVLLPTKGSEAKSSKKSNSVFGRSNEGEGTKDDSDDDNDW